MNILVIYWLLAVVALYCIHKWASFLRLRYQRRIDNRIATYLAHYQNLISTHKDQIYRYDQAKEVLFETISSFFYRSSYSSETIYYYVVKFREDMDYLYELLQIDATDQVVTTYPKRASFIFWTWIERISLILLLMTLVIVVYKLVESL